LAQVTPLPPLAFLGLVKQRGEQLDHLLARGEAGVTARLHVLQASAQPMPIGVRIGAELDDEDAAAECSGDHARIIPEATPASPERDVGFLYDSTLGLARGRNL
jgi:hypothetical protein